MEEFKPEDAQAYIKDSSGGKHYLKKVEGVWYSWGRGGFGKPEYRWNKHQNDGLETFFKDSIVWL